MPRGDGTGPAGMGPMTGRAAGYCAGYEMPGYLNPYGGRLGAGAPPTYPPAGGPGAYPLGAHGWGGYGAFGRLRPLGGVFGWRRGLGHGLGFGRGRGSGRVRGRWW